MSVSTRPGLVPLWSVTIAAETAVPITDALLGSLARELHALVNCAEDRQRVWAIVPVRARRDFEAATHAVNRFSALLRSADPHISEPIVCTARP
jgi:hypothetical protein